MDNESVEITFNTLLKRIGDGENEKNGSKTTTTITSFKIDKNHWSNLTEDEKNELYLEKFLDINLVRWSLVNTPSHQ